MLLDAPTLTRLLHHRVEPTHLRIKPGRSTHVAWRNPDTGEVGWTLWTIDPDKYAKSMFRAGDLLTVHDATGPYLFSGPWYADRRLIPALRGLPVDPAELDILRYIPHRRVVARAGERVLRVHAVPVDADPARTWLHHGVPTLPVTRHSPHIVSTPWWGAGDLRTHPDHLGAARAAGRAIARLHHTPVESGTPVCPVDPHGAADAVARHAPTLAPEAISIADRIAPLLDSDRPAVNLHGDLSPDQVLVAGPDSDEIRLIDTDRAGAGPAVRDLGTWKANASTDQWTAFCAGYREDGGDVHLTEIAAWEAYAHLSAALDPLRRDPGNENWETEVAARLDAARAALDLLPRGSVRRVWPAGERLAVEYLDADGTVRAGFHADGVFHPVPSPAGGTVISHRPGKRAVVRREDGSYSKLVKKGRARRILTAINAARPLAEHFRTPRILGAGDDHVTFAPLEGLSLHDPTAFTDEQWRTAWRDIARALGRAQQEQAPASTPVHTAADEVAVLRQWVRTSRVLVPDPVRLQEATERVIADLAGLPERLAPAHRDLHDKQLFHHPELGPGLIDVDTACLADPALDVGNLRAHARLRHLQGLWTGEQARVVTSEFPSDAAVEVYERASLVRLACVYAFRPRWAPLVAPVLGEIFSRV